MYTYILIGIFITILDRLLTEDRMSKIAEAKKLVSPQTFIIIFAVGTIIDVLLWPALLIGNIIIAYRKI